MKSTLLWWVLTRYHIWAVLTAWAGPRLAYLGVVENDPTTSLLLVLLSAIPFVGHGLIWRASWKDRDKTRGLILDKVLDNEGNWARDLRPWMAPGHPWRTIYLYNRNKALDAALRRPDLWGKWSLNTYDGPEVSGVKPTPFATGRKMWPRWVWEREAGSK